MNKNEFEAYSTEKLKSRYKTLNTVLYGLYILIVLFGLVLVFMMLKGLPPLSLIPLAISAVLISRLINYLGKKKLKMIEELDSRKAAQT